MATAGKSFITDNLRFSEKGINMLIAPEMPLFKALPADSVDFDWLDVLFDYEVLPTFVDLKNKTFPYY